jgi:hypothetical protein
MPLRRDLTIRASPQYELIVADRLEPVERERHAERTGDELYGVIRARRDPAARTLPADRSLALLFLTLRDPGCVPRAALEDLGDDAIVRLILDGVLEVEREGAFVGGPAAADVLSMAEGDASGSSPTGQRSVEALRYGQELRDLSLADLAFRLYAFGRRPLTPTVYTAAASMDTFLGLSADGAPRRALERSWRALPPASRDDVWRAWGSRALPRRGSTDGGARFKLYVSPGWRELPEAFRAVLEVASAARGVAALKLAVTPAGLCRPDKLVVYFVDLAGLRAVAGQLADRCSGWSAHVVPFTAAAASNGVLSWGVDPPRATGLGSWREWVTRLLARYLCDARAAPSSGVEPWRYALERIRLDGVDPESWSPLSGRFADLPVGLTA